MGDAVLDLTREGVVFLAVILCLGGGTLWADDMDEEDQEATVEKAHPHRGGALMLGGLWSCAVCWLWPAPSLMSRFEDKNHE